MRTVKATLAATILLLASPAVFLAQSSQPTPAVSAPRLINVSGNFRPADGQPPAPVEVVTLSIYAEQEGGTPLWQETQSVTVDATGTYSLLLGATHADGVPREVFASGEAQWLGLQFGRASEVEGPRARITSVPYALRATDAETLGGRPASDYLLAPTNGAKNGSSGATTSAAAATASGASTPSAETNSLVNPGTPNFIAKYVNGTDLGNSALYENIGFVGLGTTAPLDNFHVRFTSPNGQFTGLAVQNLGNTTSSFSGMLFFDQNGALGQFQGFNNVTHEYRINNIAQGSGFFNGSINFMIGGVSKFFVSPVTVGIGTTSPVTTANLDVSNAISGSGTTNIAVTTYSPNGFGPNVIGRKARGTEAAPTSVLNNDALLNLSANGYGATGFASVNSASISMRASENWSDTAQGSVMNFSTTASGTTTSNTRMTINQNGNVGIGVFGAQANLEVSNANGLSGAGTIFATAFANAGTSLFVGRRARGTGLAPTAVLSGDNLVGYLAQGYGTTNFSGTRGGMFVVAAENFTDTAQGTRLAFNTTATGTTAPSTKMTIDPFGNLGLGTTGPVAALDMVRETSDALEILLTRYAGTSSSGEPNISLRTARGTRAAPSAVQSGDELGGIGATGYGATGFGNGGVGIGGIAAENWTDTAQGAALLLAATPLGSNEAEVNMLILPGGNVGIGSFNDFPTITDKLQVVGDIRVGTTGTNGCIKNFAGTGLIGTCSSDRRFKKDITPFRPVLNQLAALQPVHYFWRAADFPKQQFGDSRAYGLIAQEVEEILPELVVTGADGYKAVDYSKLPLLTIQAVKELKTEGDALRADNDALRAENATLKTQTAAFERRLAELERLVSEIATSTRRH